LFGLESLRVGVDENMSWTLILDVVWISSHALHVLIGNALSIALEVKPTSNLSNYALNAAEVWVYANTPSLIRCQDLQNLFFFGWRSGERAVYITALVKMLS
jgi:hypothetical protein